MKCKRVPLGMLRSVAVLTAPITDPRNPRIQLLTAGMVITGEFIRRLDARGVDSVMLSVQDIAILNAFWPQGRRTTVPPAHRYEKSHVENDYSLASDRRLNQRTWYRPCVSSSLFRLRFANRRIVPTPTDCRSNGQRRTPR